MKNDVMVETSVCPLGCEKNDIAILSGHDRIHHLPGEFSVVRCSTCGLMRTDPRPTPESMGFYYPDDYGPYAATKISKMAGSRGRLSKWQRGIKRLIRFRTDILPDIKPGSLLEIGCASGSFLHKMAEMGWEVKGIELSEKAAAHARNFGYDVFCGAIDHASYPGNSFDLVAGWMVFEHLHDPVLSLKKLEKWVRPGGFLVISVPNAKSLDFRIFKSRWYALHLPNHLYHYTPESMNKVLIRGGWQIKKIFHQRTVSNLIASVGYVLRDHEILPRMADKFATYPQNAAWLQYLLYPLAWGLGLFGQTGRMTIWAMKKQ